MHGPRPDDHWRLRPGAPLDLGAVDPATKDGAPGDKARTREASQVLRAELAELQGRLYAEGQRSLLVVLQAMDTGGKDGTVRSVFAGVNPQGVRVTSFKRPTELEASHDPLWRVHAAAPRAGEIGVFNRSHYEDLLVPMVHAGLRGEAFDRRVEHVNAFEALLADSGCSVVKLMLHISKEEQRERLQARIDDPAKRWKMDPADLSERERWDDYQRAYEQVLAATTSDAAPWHVVPADRKWHRDWIVLSVLVGLLRDLDPRPPAAPPGAEGLVVR